MSLFKRKPDMESLASLQALAEELEIDIASIREIESYPDAFGNEWVMHINNERFASLRMRRGKPEITFEAWYSDFYYLLKPEEAIA